MSEVTVSAEPPVTPGTPAAPETPAAPPSVAPRPGRGSLIGWILFLMIEATLTQGLLSLTLVPLMVLVNIPRIALIALVGRGREARGLAVTTGVTVVAAVLALALTAWQNGVAAARADTLVAACEKYHATEGVYPASLAALVPKFLPAVPVLKPLAGTEAWYAGIDGFPYLMYVELPPFGKRVYDFQRRSWETRD